ncbi:MAG: hypothetical protein H6814_00655 [Phycisphaeraceae bacterium]|nr:hypothetical protein [Phycisphaeraceae bacterium]
MQILLDGRPIEASGNTLADALEAGRAATSSLRRVIIEVLADGVPAPEAHLSNPPVDDPYAETIEMRSASPVDLVRTTLHESADALDEAKRQQVLASDLILEAKTGEAMEKLGEAIALWSAIQRAVTDSCALFTSPELSGSLRVGPSVDDDLIDELTLNLNQVRDALQRRDWSELSDLLAFELEEQAQKWSKAIREMADGLTAATA